MQTLYTPALVPNLRPEISEFKFQPVIRAIRDIFSKGIAVLDGKKMKNRPEKALEGLCSLTSMK